MFARGQDEQQRGLTPGFLEGPQHQRLVRGRAPRHRGVLAGRVVQVDPQAGTVTMDMLVGSSASPKPHLPELLNNRLDLTPVYLKTTVLPSL